MDIDKATGMAGKVDKFFTAWGPVFKRHWGKMIIAFWLVVLGWFCWMIHEETERDMKGSYDEEEWNYDEEPYEDAYQYEE